MSHTAGGAVSRTALVLYGTETGNSHDLALELSQALERLHFLTLTDELDNVGLLDINRYDLVCIVISTTGQGEFPSDARKFWLSALRKKLLPTTLHGVRYALIGLCDSSYPKFNFAARKLDKRLRQLGAQSLLQSCEADEQGDQGTEGAVLAWLPLFKEACLHTFPLLEGQDPIPDQVRLPSRLTLARATNASYPAPSNLSNNGAHPLTVNSSDSSALSFEVVLEKNDRVTPPTHWQDVRFLQLKSDRPVQYLPGDALAISPRNSPDDVNQLIDLLGWSSVADEPLTVEHNLPHIPSDGAPDPTLNSVNPVTLRELLTTDLDILAVPKRSFFANIAHFTDDETQKERAVEFTDPQYLDEYFDYATRPRRSILEVLQEFNTVKIPWTEALSVFPKLRPRQFSIASGGCQKEGGTSFDLLVAVVKYRTVIKRIRRGVCTKYLANLPLGTRLNVLLHTEGRFNSQAFSIQAQRHLLIGGGTGVAPLRAIIHEKSNSVNIPVQSVLFFGCRNADSDFFFREEWSRLTTPSDTRAAPNFQLITAFSRDQANKVYVQDRLREHAVLVKELLCAENINIVVCGSSGNMPKAVRQALKDVLATKTKVGEEGLDEIEAEAFLVKLEKSGRYKQETW